MALFPLHPLVSTAPKRSIQQLSHEQVAAVHNGAHQTKTLPPRPFMAPYHVHGQQRTLDWGKNALAGTAQLGVADLGTKVL